MGDISKDPSMPFGEPAVPEAEAEAARPAADSLVGSALYSALFRVGRYAGMWPPSAQVMLWSSMDLMMVMACSVCS